MKERQTFQLKPQIVTESQIKAHKEDEGMCCTMVFVKTYCFQLVLHPCFQINSQEDANACYEHKHTCYYGGID